MTAPPVEALVALHAERDDRAWQIAGCEAYGATLEHADDSDADGCPWCASIREHWPAQVPSDAPPAARHKR